VFRDPAVVVRDNCLTGDKFKENRIADTDVLLACTFDDGGNLVSTLPAGNGRLQWFIAPAGGGESTAMRFPESPPIDTGTDGTVTVELEAFRNGNDFIEVCLQDDPGGNAGADCSSVQKRVTSTNHGGPGCFAIVGTNGADVLTGTASRDCIRGKGGADNIRGAGGNDALKGGLGSDRLRGGRGVDTLKGGRGADRLDGGPGRDSCFGGPGNDTRTNCE
jgi:Ca2+-binding RTX toxin-like protein